MGNESFQWFLINEDNQKRENRSNTIKYRYRSMCTCCAVHRKKTCVKKSVNSS